MKKTQIALFYLLSFGHWQAQADETLLLDRIVAIVNENVITASQVSERVRDVIQQSQQRGNRLPSQEILIQRVLERLVLEDIQLQFADRTGIRVEDSALNKTIRKVAQDNEMDLSQFRRTIESDGIDFNRFREDLRQRMLIKRLQQRQVINDIVISPNDIDNFISNQQRQGDIQIQYKVLHILVETPEAASPEQIADKQLRAEEVLTKLAAGADFRELAATYSDAAQALEGGDLGWRRTARLPDVFVDALNDMKKGDNSALINTASGFHIIQLEDKRSDEESIITQTKARHILLKPSEILSNDEARNRLNQLKERLEAGEDFTELAKIHSEDVVSARDGGDLGWTSPNQLVNEFEEMMASLELNNISEPFRTRYGWHIMQVLERRQHDNTEKARRSRATKLIRQRKAEEELQAWKRQLRAESYVEYRL